VQKTKVISANAIFAVKCWEEALDTTIGSTDKKSEVVTGKKPYKAPSFKFQTAFEVSALSCGKLAGTGGGCSLSKKAS
jgi:hypothetical protein